MVEAIQPFTLTQDDAIDILQSTTDRSPIRLIALDCNWGPRPQFTPYKLVARCGAPRG